MDLFEWDALTGTAEYFAYDNLTDKSIIRTEQDVEPLLNYNAGLRNEGIKDVLLKDNIPSIRHYATVPIVVIMELKQKGIDFFDQNDMPKVLDEINQNYPYLKVTDKTHAVKR
jgi:hypothetical protein